MSKQKLVIFEGCDGSGKSSLYQEFRRATAYQILCIDRFIGSQVVYDELYEREDKKALWREEETKLSQLYDVYLVIMTASYGTLERRISSKESGKDLTRALRNYAPSDLLFRRYQENSPIPNKIIIDSDRSLSDCLGMVLSFIGEGYQKDPGREAFEG